MFVTGNPNDLMFYSLMDGWNASYFQSCLFSILAAMFDEAMVAVQLLPPPPVVCVCCIKELWYLHSCRELRFTIECSLLGYLSSLVPECEVVFDQPDKVILALTLPSVLLGLTLFHTKFRNFVRGAIRRLDISTKEREAKREGNRSAPTSPHSRPTQTALSSYPATYDKKIDTALCPSCLGFSTAV